MKLTEAAEAKLLVASPHQNGIDRRLYVIESRASPQSPVDTAFRELIHAGYVRSQTRARRAREPGTEGLVTPRGWLARKVIGSMPRWNMP